MIPDYYFDRNLKIDPAGSLSGLSRENRIMSIVLSSHTTETILSLVPAGQHLALPMSVLKAQNSHSKAY